MAENETDTNGQTEESGKQESGGETPPAWTPPKDQAQLDRIIRDRINREREKYADYNDLKTKASEFDKIKEANQSELEKAQTRAQELEEKATKAEQRAMQMAIRSAVINEASKQKAISPEAVYKLIDTGTLTVKEDGTVEGVNEAVTALLGDNTFLVGTGFTGSSDGGQRGNGITIHKRSKIAEPKYFQDHRADILAAQAEPGRPRISDE
jgi:hypothetical protein